MKQKIWLLVAILAIVAAIMSIFFFRMLASDKEAAWQEQYDLGTRYLSEGSYEEAALAFCAAIEIDPKRSEAYIGAAEAYVALGDTEAAERILQQGAQNTDQTDMQDHLDRITEQWAPEPERRLVKILETDEYGNVNEYLLSYNEKGLLSGVQSGPITEQYFYDEEDRYVRKTVDGTTYDMYTYDSDGNVTHRTYIYGDHKFDYEYHYDAQGVLTSCDYYLWGNHLETFTCLCNTQNQIMEEIHEDYTIYYTYDEEGRIIRKESVYQNADIQNEIFIYDYEAYKPFVFETNESNHSEYEYLSMDLIMQDVAGHEIWQVDNLVGLSSVKTDSEGYVVSAQNEYFTYTFVYEETAEENPPSVNPVETGEIVFTGTLDAFRQQKGYLSHWETYISPMDAQPVPEDYALLDIDQDGIDELIIHGQESLGTGFQYFLVYTYIPEQNAVIRLKIGNSMDSDYFICYTMKYAPEDHALACCFLRPNQYVGGYEFCVKSGNSVEFAFNTGWTTDEAGTYYIYYDDSDYRILSDAEYETYMDRAESISFLPLP